MCIKFGDFCFGQPLKTGVIVAIVFCIVVFITCGVHMAGTGGGGYTSYYFNGPIALLSLIGAIVLVLALVLPDNNKVCLVIFLVVDAITLILMVADLLNTIYFYLIDAPSGYKVPIPVWIHIALFILCFLYKLYLYAIVYSFYKEN